MCCISLVHRLTWMTPQPCCGYLAWIHKELHLVKHNTRRRPWNHYYTVLRCIVLLYLLPGRYDWSTYVEAVWKRLKHQPLFIPQQCKYLCCQAKRSGWCNACLCESRRDCLQPSAGRKRRLAMAGYQCKISELHSSYRKMGKKSITGVNPALWVLSSVALVHNIAAFLSTDWWI